MTRTVVYVGGEKVLAEELFIQITVISKLLVSLVK